MGVTLEGNEDGLDEEWGLLASAEAAGNVGKSNWDEGKEG